MPRAYGWSQISLLGTEHFRANRDFQYLTTLMDSELILEKDMSGTHIDLQYWWSLCFSRNMYFQLFFHFPIHPNEISKTSNYNSWQEIDGWNSPLLESMWYPEKYWLCRRQPWFGIFTLPVTTCMKLEFYTGV